MSGAPVQPVMSGWMTQLLTAMGSASKLPLTTMLGPAAQAGASDRARKAAATGFIDGLLK